MIEIHRHFERFAASLVRCLSEASCARKTSESATGQNAVNGFRFSDPYIYLSFYLYVNNLEPSRSQIKISQAIP